MESIDTAPVGGRFATDFQKRAKRLWRSGWIGVYIGCVSSFEHDAIVAWTNTQDRRHMMRSQRLVSSDGYSNPHMLVWFKKLDIHNAFVEYVKTLRRPNRVYLKPDKMDRAVDYLTTNGANFLTVNWYATNQQFNMTIGDDDHAAMVRLLS